MSLVFRVLMSRCVIRVLGRSVFRVLWFWHICKALFRVLFTKGPYV
jgi:hypothetical protein